MLLPETAFPDMAWEQDFGGPVFMTQSEEFQFKLAGMEDFQSSVAGLVSKFASTPTTDAGMSTSLGMSDEEWSLPSTPQVLEEGVSLGPPPGLELEAVWMTEPEEASAAPPGLESEAEATAAPEGALAGPPGLEPEAEMTPQPEEATSATEPKKKGWGTAPTPEARKVLANESGQSSVMLQNVPRKCSRDLLSKRLDEAGFRGDYNLIYVTADLKQRHCGSGSALVNFCSEEACTRFTAAFHKTGVASAFPGFVGKKAIEVMPAPIQGLKANVQKLEKSGVLMSMLAERPGWQPARYNKAGEIEEEIGGS